jgi:hypothetical protein
MVAAGPTVAVGFGVAAGLGEGELVEGLESSDDVKSGGPEPSPSPTYVTRPAAISAIPASRLTAPNAITARPRADLSPIIPAGAFLTARKRDLHACLMAAYYHVHGKGRGACPGLSPRSFFLAPA